MKTKILTIILFIFSFPSFSQVATIKDPDGWSNIRKEAKQDSDVICKANEGDILWFDYDEYYSDSSWVKVYMQIKGEVGEIIGYVHRTRLLPLNEAPDYKGSDFIFKYFLSQFDTVNRVIVLSEDKWVETIDGKRPMGVDGDLPRIQVDSMFVSLYDKEIIIDRKHYIDLFEINTKIKIIKIKDLFIVYHGAGDGAGGYDLVWVFDKNGLVMMDKGSLL